MVDPLSFKDSRSFTSGDSANPFTKREQFSISLRKQKKQEILNQKRRKLIQKVEEQLKNQEKFPQVPNEQKPFDSTEYLLSKECPEYGGPPDMIRDKNSYNIAINQLAPYLYEQPTINQKVVYILDLLSNSTDEACAKQQLALMVAMRQCLCDQSLSPDHFLSVITQTQILNVLMSILNAAPSSQVIDEEVYWLQMEALWIVICLSNGTEECVERLLISQPGEYDDVEYKHNYGLVHCFNQMMQRVLDGECQDMKMLSMVYWAIMNIIMTEGEVFCSQILCDTIVTDSFTLVHQKLEQVPREIQDFILTIIKQSATKCKLQNDVARGFVSLAVQELQKDQETDDELKFLSANILYLIFKTDSIYAQMACVSDIHTIKALVGMCNGTNQQLSQMSFQALSMMATCETQNMTELLLQEDFFSCLQLAMTSTDVKHIEQALFTLSNMLVEDKGISAFSLNPTFMVSVFLFMENPNHVMASEATWAICNMVTSSTAPLLKSIMLQDEEKNMELIIGQLSNALYIQLKVRNQSNLQLNVMQALQRIFDLESEELMSTSSQSSNQQSPYQCKAIYYAEQRGLCDILDKLILSQNEEVANLANNISSKYFQSNYVGSNNLGYGANQNIEMDEDKGQNGNIFNI